MMQSWKNALLVPVLLALGATANGGQSIAFTWNTSATNIAGYKIYYGGASRTYTNSLNAANLPDITITGLTPGATYFLAATTYNPAGVESALSDEISLAIPVNVTNPPPSITLAAPASAAAPANLTLAAAVTANNNAITKVQFFNGATLLGEAVAAPYEFAWNNVAVGSYSVSARVVYGSGSTADSAPVTIAVNNTAATRYTFTQADRASLVAGGWDFLARTAAGATRNTEITNGATVDYNQAVHPGTLRIPCDAGDLWENINDSRNSLFRNLPADWTSVRVKLAFAPTQNTEQASLVAYQDDDNYLQVTREFNGGNKISFVQELRGAASGLQTAAATATTNLHLRLDRDAANNRYSAFYSLNGTDWLALGTALQTLANPRVGLVVCSSPGGLPNAEISWVEVFTPQAAPNLSNSVPTLNALANVVLNEDAPQQTVNLAGITSGATNEIQTLTVTAASSNPALIPNPTVTYTSPNTTGSLQFTPKANLFGTATITVTVNDGGASNNTVARTFTVTVNPVNDAPTLAALANLTISQNTSTQTVTLAGITAGATNEAQTLTIIATSSNPALISAPVVNYASPNSSGVLLFTPKPGVTGTATVTVTVNDGSASNNVTLRTFTVTVTAPVLSIAPGYAQMSLDSTLLQAGQSTNVTLNFSSATGVTVLDVVLVLPPERLTNISVQAIAPGIDFAASTLTPQSAGTWLLHLVTKTGQTLSGSAAIAQLGFTARADQRSAFVPLTVSAFSGTGATGTPIVTRPAQAGRAVIIAEESLLEAGRNPDGSPAITLYGKPGRNYALEYSAQLGGAATWTRLALNLTGNNIAKSATGLTAPAGNVFYRAVEIVP